MAFPLQRLQARAAELGFSFAGVTPAEPSPYLDAYLRWVDAGMHGSMGYLARPDRLERRRDLNIILPGVRSLVMVGLDYRTLPIPPEVLHDPARGRIASYAWGLDYHDILTPRLQTLAEWLRAEAGELSYRVYVDTGAVLERSHAYAAGLGFTGKNTMLIHPRRGSYFFLGEILTDIAFDDYSTPGKASMCGGCTRCLNACPTDAFPRPYTLDARRCISYLTIEHKGWIDRDLRPLMGNWVYGCDVCQEVCPWQRFSLPTDVPDFYPDSADVYGHVAPPLLDLLTMDLSAFEARFAGSAITRIKRDRMVRNACIAAGNWGDTATLPALLPLLHDSSPLVRGHAAWAVRRVMGSSANAAIEPTLQTETDEAVIAELETLLAGDD